MKRNRWTYLPRWVNCIIARVGGYFWLPCPLCGEMQGGHEWDGRVGSFIDDGIDPQTGVTILTGVGCCWKHEGIEREECQ